MNITIHEKWAHAIKSLKKHDDNSMNVQIAIFKDVTPISLNVEKRIEHGQRYEIAIIMGVHSNIVFKENTMFYLYVNGVKITQCLFYEGSSFALFDAPITWKQFYFFSSEEKENGFDVCIHSPFYSFENVVFHMLYGAVHLNKRKLISCDFIGTESDYVLL